jgi:hypothetical protein
MPAEQRGCSDRPLFGSLSLMPLILGLVLVIAACSPKPGISVPTPDCGAPILTIASSRFPIETIEREADGSIKIPADHGGSIAYWIDGTSTNQVFLFALPAGGIQLAGTTAAVTRQNCNSSSYTLEAPQPGSIEDLPLADQSSPGITILFQEESSGSAVLVRGSLAGETITTINTPASAAADIQAEVSLLDTTASADGKTLRIGVSILNTGKSSIKLTTGDVALASEDGSTSNPVKSEPSLPQTIKRGATATIYFTFGRPSSPTATLKVFDIEYDIEGY